MNYKENNEDAILDKFLVKSMDSTNIDFYGFNQTGDAFIQFKSGRTYFYKVSKEDHAAFLAGGYKTTTIIRKELRKLVTPK